MINDYYLLFVNRSFIDLCLFLTGLMRTADLKHQFPDMYSSSKHNFIILYSATNFATLTLSLNNKLTQKQKLAGVAL